MRGVATATSATASAARTTCAPFPTIRVRPSERALQEGEERGGIARESRERRDRVAVGIDDGVERKRDGAELPLLERLLAVVDVAVAVGEEAREHVLVERRLDLGAREDVRLHPAAVGAGVAGEVDEDAPVLALGERERAREIVEHPVQLDRNGTGRGDRRESTLGREERLERAERASGQSGREPHAEREKRDREATAQGSQRREERTRPARFGRRLVREAER